jgi:hypothetical protein
VKKVSASLILLLFISSCVSAPISSSTESANSKSTQIFEFFTPTNDGVSIQLTENMENIIALQTASETPIPTRSPTQTSTPKPTFSPSPEPENPILISKTNYSGDGVDEFTSCLRSLDTYSFVLYKDGHLIISKGNYLEAVVPLSEIDKLMSEIQSTGFFTLTGNDDQYIANAPTPLPSGWSWGSRITVKDTSISLRGDISSDYEVEAIKKTKRLIDELAPPDLKPFKPNTILAYVILIDNPSFDVYEPKPSPPLLQWSRDKIQLDTLSAEFANLVSGEPLEFFMQQIQTIPTFRMVEQEGKYYLVATCPYFP